MSESSCIDSPLRGRAMPTSYSGDLRESKSAAPKPRGGSVSPLEEFAEQILDLIAHQPDLTLVETVAELRKRRIRTSRRSLWRFLDCHEITLKKSLQAA